MLKNSQGHLKSYSDNSNNRLSQVTLFCEEISVFGYVPFVFFMPNLNKHDIDFINSNGGEISHLVECFTIQLYKPNKRRREAGEEDKIPIEEYYPGNIVSF